MAAGASSGKERTRLAELAVAAGAVGFVALTLVARLPEATGLDRAILLALRSAADPLDPIGPAWLEAAVRDVTALGGTVVLIYVTAAVVTYLALAGKRGEALFVFLSVAGGQALSSLLKLTIDRPRPDVVPHLVDVQTLSFPSGHAMMSAVTYLTLGLLLARVLPGRASRGFVLGLAVLTTLMVGASRVYLGVHWPSDVLAGWCAGIAWAAACWLVLNRLEPKPPGGSGQR